MKKFLGFLLLLLISSNAFSQANEQDINALSIFSEYVKALSRSVGIDYNTCYPTVYVLTIPL